MPRPRPNRRRTPAHERSDPTPPDPRLLVDLRFTWRGATVVRRMSIKKADPEGERVQLRCEEMLPPPAVWDFRKLLLLHQDTRVHITTNDTWFVGTVTGAAGRNITISRVKPTIPVPDSTPKERT
jgi:hypothetical protein